MRKNMLRHKKENDLIKDQPIVHQKLGKIIRQETMNLYKKHETPLNAINRTSIIKKRDEAVPLMFSEKKQELTMLHPPKHV